VKGSYRKFEPRTVGLLWADSGHRFNLSGAMMAQNPMLHRRKSAWSPYFSFINGAASVSKGGKPTFATTGTEAYYSQYKAQFLEFERPLTRRRPPTLQAVVFVIPSSSLY
jgi:hypothetical protein